MAETEYEDTENGWVPAEGTTLDALLAVADWRQHKFEDEGTPWEPNYELEIKGLGGIHSRDKHRITIAPRLYQSYVTGDRTSDISGDYTMIGERDVVTTVGPVAGSSKGTGHDKLTVKGDAEWTFHEKRTLMTGTYNRRWEGRIDRFIGMEGVICGGVFTKTYVGAQSTLAGVFSGDVFGGCARFSASRNYLAGMNYRSADNAAWAAGIYVRGTAVTIEPAIGSPGAMMPASTAMATAARLALTVMPFLEIGIGLAMLPIGIVMAVAALVRRRPAAPLVGPPRLRNRTVGCEIRSNMSEMIC